MIILGIETSCDETGVAVFSSETGLIGHSLHSQISLHQRYGGVVPELASRDHIKKLLPLIKGLLSREQIDLISIGAIAFTEGPGLAGALLVGASMAHSIALSLGIPALGINHLEGHIFSPFLTQPRPPMPFLALIISGGHTQLINVKDIGCYDLIGDTLDDAVGEAYDKSAKVLGLGYPGGAKLAELAKNGYDKYDLPRPLLNDKSLNFSFSGLKTALVRLIQTEKNTPDCKANIAASFQSSVTDVLTHKAFKALKQFNLKELVVAGGVSANHHLRQRINSIAEKTGVNIYYPELDFCTDNAAMIAYVGYERIKRHPDYYTNSGFSVRPRWPITSLEY